MRTTLTIDDDVGQALKKLGRTSGRSFRAIVNETLRRGLGSSGRASARKSRVRIHARAGGFAPGIDALKLNRLVDDLDVDQFADKHAGKS